MKSLKLIVLLSLIALCLIPVSSIAKTQKVAHKSLIEYFHTTKAGFNGPFFIIDKSFVQASEKMKVSLGIKDIDYEINQNIVTDVRPQSVDFLSTNSLLAFDAVLANNQTPPSKKSTTFNSQGQFFNELEAMISSPD